MLYIFKSRATANLIMLQPNAERLLEIIGKGGTKKGILLPEQMAAAVAALELALAKEDADMKQAASDATGEGLPNAGAVSLRQRAAPFIDMLRRCQKADTEVVWGV